MFSVLVLFWCCKMAEDRVLKLLNDIGVSNVNEDDYKVYEDYFAVRDSEVSSEEHV